MPCGAVPIYLPLLTYWLTDGKGEGGLGELEAEPYPC